MRGKPLGTWWGCSYGGTSYKWHLRVLGVGRVADVGAPGKLCPAQATASTWQSQTKQDKAGLEFQGEARLRDRVDSQADSLRWAPRLLKTKACVQGAKCLGRCDRVASLVCVWAAGSKEQSSWAGNIIYCSSCPQVATLPFLAF